jgi:hypothetical protein
VTARLPRAAMGDGLWGTVGAAAHGGPPGTGALDRDGGPRAGNEQKEFGNGQGVDASRTFDEPSIFLKTVP